MPNRGAQGIVDSLAERLHRSVVVGDRNLHVLYSSRHFRDEDPVRVEAILNREANSRAIEYVLAQGVAGWTNVGVIPPIRTWGWLPASACRCAGMASCWPS